MQRTESLGTVIVQCFVLGVKLLRLWLSSIFRFGRSIKDPAQYDDAPKGHYEQCKVCRTGSDYKYRAAMADPESENHAIASALELFQELRFGALYQCYNCKTLWYFNPDSDRVSCTSHDRLDLILAWNKEKIVLSDADTEVLDVIGMQPRPSWQNNYEYPCSVLTATGEKIDTAILCFQPFPPYEPHVNYRLASEIAEVSPSPFALPFEIRLATTEAREIRNSFAPTFIEADGEAFTLNWEPRFFSIKGRRAKNIRLMEEKFDANSAPPLASGAGEIVFFVADLVET